MSVDPHPWLSTIFANASIFSGRKTEWMTEIQKWINKTVGINFSFSRKTSNEQKKDLFSSHFLISLSLLCARKEFRVNNLIGTWFWLTEQVPRCARCHFRFSPSRLLMISTVFLRLHSQSKAKKKNKKFVTKGIYGIYPLNNSSVIKVSLSTVIPGKNSHFGK